MAAQFNRATLFGGQPKSQQTASQKEDMTVAITAHMTSTLGPKVAGEVLAMLATKAGAASEKLQSATAEAISGAGLTAERGMNGPK
jgi:hypothetical protein